MAGHSQTWLQPRNLDVRKLKYSWKVTAILRGQKRANFGIGNGEE
jgi:hypothetical protein